MSSLRHADYRSRTARSQSSRTSDRVPMATIAGPDLSTSTPQEHIDRDFAPCAATGSFFLYAQKNLVVALHHDTLRIERIFDKHREDVLLISADNISDRGSGRLIVSYDAGQTAIVWDLLSGDEIARFASFEDIRVASFMRDSSIAFGNSQGSVILFEPSTSEHVSARTIFNPVTALAPAADCRIFAIGYLNGSILIATLQPFTILHTLNTSRAPSPITGLAWHGSSSKQKTDMLATQTSDGDLRVWSVAKPPSNEVPRIIRILQGPSEEYGRSRRSWFAWSKNGRLVQYSDGVTRTWDVRTKRVTHEDVPTIDNVSGITNYGPTATLFTIGPNHTVQQYDINPQSTPIMVASVQHVPANAPPTPPDSIEEIHAANERSGSISESVSSHGPSPPPHIEVESSEDDGPIQRMHREMDLLEEERKDNLGPLSPVSSRASLSSASSSYAGRRPKRNKRSMSSKASDVSGSSSQHTFFSDMTSPSVGESQESFSIRTSTSTASSSYSRPQQTLPTDVPPETSMHGLDLFPYTRARLTEVKFRAPQYGSAPNPDSLRQEMLSVVFGWDEDVETLIRTEQAYQPPGAPSIVLLSKWLGELGSDSLAQMVGSQSMTSSDWMLLALSMNMDSGAHKQMSEAFVTRLLRSNEIHPAVAILIGLGEINDAIEAYVTRNHFLEAILLTCLMFPNDWQRQSYLVRKWGEASVADGYHEFAVRCFSCTSIESSEPWFSPRAKDAVYAAQQQSLAAVSPPTSPPSATAPGRIAAKNASLGRLVTNLPGAAAQSKAPLNIGVTPIIDSAISPGGATATWNRSKSRDFRDPSSARTATPGGYGRRRRGPSVEPGIREDEDDDATPYVSSRRLPSRPSSRLSNKDPGTAIKLSRMEEIPSPGPGAFRLRQEHSRAREGSRDRNHNRLHLQVSDETEPLPSASPQPPAKHTRASRSSSSLAKEQRPEDFSPLLTDGSSRSYKERSIDRYISSLEDSAFHQSSLRADGGSRNDRSRSRPRQRDESRPAKDTAYIKPSKKSPSSPAAMTSEDAHKYSSSRDSMEDERFYYGVTSPVESLQSTRPRASSKQPRAPSRRDESPETKAGARSGSKAVPRAASRARHTSPDGRGRDESRHAARQRSPSASSIDKSDAPVRQTIGAGARARSRQRSSSRLAASGRTRSSSRHPVPEPRSAIERSTRLSDEFDVDSMPSTGRPRAMSKKELAAKELEERRLSLARRPLAPAIPLPGDLGSGRPTLSPRAYTESEIHGQHGIARSQTVDPHEMRKYNPSSTSGVSTMSVPIGLPATPRAMRHPRYMTSEPDAQDNIPAVPAVPETLLTLQPITYQPFSSTAETDGLGPLLPSTTYVRDGPKRSSSAPPEKSMGQPQRPRRDSFKSGHSRRASERDNEPIPSIGQTISEEQNIIIVDESPEDLRVLPELAHLSTPPPPPPPPAFPGMTQAHDASPGGIINIAIDGSGGPSVPGLSLSRTTTPATNSANAEHPTPSASPNMARKSYASGDSVSENSIGSKWSKMRDRFRESSRSRRNTKSPPTPATATEPFNPSPYETIISAQSFNRTKSPEYAQTSYSESAILPQRPTPVGSPDNGYRNPKEIRANLPPEQLQAGVYVPLHEALGQQPPARKPSVDHGAGSNMI